MTPCSRCHELERASAKTEPHASLILAASVELLPGVREEYVCATCEQRMIRFRAKQTAPPPSDVWRLASTAATQRTILENILPRIPAPYIADALQALPPADSAAHGAFTEALVNVPGIGRVRITAKRMRNGRSLHYFWKAASAVLAYESR
jgi:hypothetical protein